MLATMRTTGMMFSLAIATVTFALFIGSTQIGPEVQEPFMTSLRVAFSIFAVLCTIGIFASLPAAGCEVNAGQVTPQRNKHNRPAPSSSTTSTPCTSFSNPGKSALNSSDDRR